MNKCINCEGGEWEKMKIKTWIKNFIIISSSLSFTSLFVRVIFIRQINNVRTINHNDFPSRASHSRFSFPFLSLFHYFFFLRRNCLKQLCNYVKFLFFLFRLFASLAHKSFNHFKFIVPSILFLITERVKEIVRSLQKKITILLPFFTHFLYSIIVYL